MKKHHGILALALTALFTVTTLAITVTTYAQRDKVVMTEEIVYGDKALVSDVILTHGSTMNRQLIWHTTVPLGDVNQAFTDFQASRTSIPNANTNQGELEIHFMFNTSGSTSGTFDFDQEDYDMTSFPIEILRAVASRTPLNATHSETLRVADYGDYYTPEVYVDFPDDAPLGGYYYFSRHDDEDSLLTDYFRIPVKPEDMATVSMEANGQGVYAIDLDFLGEDNTKGNTASAFDGTTGFYVAVTDQGDTVLHHVTFAVQESDDRLLVDSMEAVLTLPNLPLQGQGIVKRQNQNQLLIFTGQEETEQLHIFDMDTNTVIQTIDINGFDGWDVEQGDDYFVLLSGYDFHVYQTHNHTYSLVLTGNYAEHLNTEHTSYTDDLTMIYTPGRLLTAVRSWSYESNDHMTLAVSMNTQEGCVFTATYASSLQQDNFETYYPIDAWGQTLELTLLK